MLFWVVYFFSSSHATDTFSFRYLASQDAIEVMCVTDLLTVSIDLTDVTLVNDDNHVDKDEEDKEDEALLLPSTFSRNQYSVQQGSFGQL